jgi:7-keto-8-aminopelargonate synthetase-like enzyme
MPRCRPGRMPPRQKIRRFRHLDGTEAERHLREIRSTDSQNGILVVTEGL